MKNVKTIVLSAIVIVTVIIGSGFTECTPSNEKKIGVPLEKNKQTINMFVSHGHCNTPFSGTVNNLKLELVPRKDLGNPLEGMRLSFEINPSTFNVCASEELTQKNKGSWPFYWKRQ